MTILLNNNFDGGVTGTTITAANSGFNAADTAFDYVNTLNGGVLQYANVGALGLNRDTAEYVMLMSSGSASLAQAYAGWNVSAVGTQTTFWARFYVCFSGFLLNTTYDTCLFSAYHTSGLPGVSIFLACDTGNWQLYIWNGYSSTFSQMTTVLVVGMWNRVEISATMSTSVGTADLYLYADPNSDGITPTEHVSQTGQNYGTTSVNTATVGMDYGAQQNTPGVYFSNFQFNNTGYPGPAPYRPGAGCPGILTNPIAIHSDIC